MAAGSWWLSAVLRAGTGSGGCPAPPAQLPRDTWVVRARAPHSRRLRRRPGARSTPHPPRSASRGACHSSAGARRCVASAAAPSNWASPPPIFQEVRGFGRSSKQLGISTANFPEQVVDNLPADVSTGIYYGWASTGSGDVHKMVVSIRRNPYWKNVKKTKETHIIHTFKEDFYGEILNVAGHCWLPQT